MLCRFFLILSFLWLLVGCASEQVETEYGRASSPISAKSVNGTTVFKKMFEAHGARVTSARRLTPNLFEKADCIVWIPDRFLMPKEDVACWFEDWLLDKPGRTLIYVARDYEAAVDYWEYVLDDFETEEDRRDARAELSGSRLAHGADRRVEPAELIGEWFSIEPGDIDRPEKLTSDAGWLDGIDVEKTELRLGYFPVFDDSYTPLLETEDGPFVAKTVWGESRMIVVANGSFLLNYPLVNHEHRKLAARLIETVNTKDRVVFVESGRSGLTISDQDEPSRNVWDVVTRPPFNWMTAQFVALGVVFCFCRWPIFGRPRQLEGAALTDFGRHITALGRLLRQNGNQRFAEEELRKYHEEIGRPKGK